MHRIWQSENRPANFITQNSFRWPDTINSELVIAMKERGEFPSDILVENRNTSNPCIAIQQTIKKYLGEQWVIIDLGDIFVAHRWLIGDISPSINYMEIKNYQWREIRYTVGDSQCDTLHINKWQEGFSLRLPITERANFLNDPESMEELFKVVNDFTKQMNKFVKHHPKDSLAFSQPIWVEVNNDGIYTLRITWRRNTLPIKNNEAILRWIKWWGNNNEQLKMLCCGRDDKREIWNIPKEAA